MDKNSVKNTFSAPINRVDLDILLKDIYKVLYDVEQVKWDNEHSLVKTESLLRARLTLKKFRDSIKNK